LAAKHKRHLLQGQSILALGHKFIDEAHVIHLLGNSECIREFVKLSIYTIDRIQGLSQLIAISSVITACEQVIANTFVVVFVAKVSKFVKALHFHHQVDSLALLIMINEFGDNLVNKAYDIVDGLPLLNSVIVLIADLTGKTSEVLVPPANQVSLGAL